MWIFLAIISALCLGFYDIFKKISVLGNDVLMVLMLNTVFGALYMSPFLISGICHGNWGFGNTIHGHLLILLKSAIVLCSWILGYFAIKHLPLTVQGPINASRPVMVLVGALIIFGERLNWLQWLGILLGFASLFFISRIGAKEGFSFKHSKWIWMSIGATIFGAISALYDKHLLRSFNPIEVQSWYSLYQCIIMTATILIIKSIQNYHLNPNQSRLSPHPSVRRCKGKALASIPSSGAQHPKFHWRWSIPFIALFLTVADMCYFYSLSLPGSMIAVVSMIRRGSVIVSFLYGVFILHEKNIGPKLMDLSILLLSLLLLVLGSAA